MDSPGNILFIVLNCPKKQNGNTNHKPLMRFTAFCRGNNKQAQMIHLLVLNCTFFEPNKQQKIGILHFSPNRFTCMGFLLLSEGCIHGPHAFTLVSHLSPTLGGLGRMILHLPRTCFPLWVVWAAWFYTCLPLVFSRSGCSGSHDFTPGPRDFRLVSHLSPSPGALGRVILHVSPTCLPHLVAILNALGRMILHLSATLGGLGRMILHLSPTCFHAWRKVCCC